MDRSAARRDRDADGAGGWHARGGVGGGGFAATREVERGAHCRRGGGHYSGGVGAHAFQVDDAHWWRGESCGVHHGADRCRDHERAGDFPAAGGAAGSGDVAGDGDAEGWAPGLRPRCRAFHDAAQCADGVRSAAHSARWPIVAARGA